MSTRQSSPPAARRRQPAKAAPPPSSAPEDLRQTILDTSVRLIEAEGLDKLSLRAVARELGVSHQAPYYHFRDRETILANVAARGFALLHETMSAAAEKKRTAKSRLAAAGKAYVQFALDRPGYFTVMFLAGNVAGVEQRREESDRTFQYLVSLVREASPRGDQGTLIASSWAVVHGLAVLIRDGVMSRHIKGDRERSDALIDRVLANFVEQVFG